MKIFALAMFFTFMFVSTNAQDKQAYWFTDLDSAKTYAKMKDANILMVFAGSDWCKPCIKFKKTILESDEFSKYAEASLAILYLDFPVRKANKLSKEKEQHHEKLAKKYNYAGAFPNIVLLSNEEKVLAKPKFKNQTPAAFIQSIAK